VAIATPPDIRIVHLAEVPATAAVLADWFVAEWAPWYGPGGDGDAAADLAARCRRDALPLALVALDPGGGVLGTAALTAEAVADEPGAGPWLAALLVGPGHRGRGVGTALVAAIEAEARRLGFGAVYTSTDAADRIMARRGWLAVDTAATLRGPATVFCRRFDDR